MEVTALPLGWQALWLKPPERNNRIIRQKKPEARYPASGSVEMASNCFGARL